MTSAHQSGGTSSLPSRLDLNINANEGQHRGDDVGHADVDNTQVVQRLRAYRDNETQEPDEDKTNRHLRNYSFTHIQFRCVLAYARSHQDDSIFFHNSDV